MFKGCFTAIVTPFKKDGSLDEESLRRHVEEQVRKGIDGLVPVGTTGESPTLSHEEHRRVVEITLAQARGRVPVIAGAGSNSTEEAIDLARHAKKAGAAATLQIAPYYNKPDQEGMLRHFGAIAKAAALPMVLYNHAGRTGVAIEPATVCALAKKGGVVAVKDASGGLDYASRVIEGSGGKVGVLSGNDGWTLGLMAVGGAGVISVVANIAPKEMTQMTHAAAAGDFAKARKIHYKLLPLVKAVELQGNPASVKGCLALMGKIENTLRLPMTPMSRDNTNRARAALMGAGLLR